jgi:hypothetical protein
VASVLWDLQKEGEMGGGAQGTLASAKKEWKHPHFLSLLLLALFPPSLPPPSSLPSSRDSQKLFSWHVTSVICRGAA